MTPVRILSCEVELGGPPDGPGLWNAFCQWSARNGKIPCVRARLYQVEVSIEGGEIVKRWRELEDRDDASEPLPPGAEIHWSAPLDRIRTVELQRADQFTGMTPGSPITVSPWNAKVFFAKRGKPVPGFKLFQYSAADHWVLFLFMNDGHRLQVTADYDGYARLLRHQAALSQAIEETRKGAAPPAPSADYL